MTGAIIEITLLGQASLHVLIALKQELERKKENQVPRARRKPELRRSRMARKNLMRENNPHLAFLAVEKITQSKIVDLSKNINVAGQQASGDKKLRQMGILILVRNFFRA